MNGKQGLRARVGEPEKSLSAQLLRLIVSPAESSTFSLNLPFIHLESIGR
jgi:hypothetical protein